MSATDCPVCWRAEASWKERLVKAVLDRLDPPSPFQGYGAMIAAVRERFVAVGAGAEAVTDDIGDDVGDDGATTEEDGS